MAPSRTLFIGMDVPKDAIAVAYVAHEHGAAGPYLGAGGTRQCDIAQRLRTRPSKAPHLLCVSAAGPGGSWLSRSLPHKGDDCWVVAPSLLPQQAGDRVTTARRDAMPLARLARSGALPLVSVPQGDAEAMRDLTRAREETLSDLQDATLRLTACLLRHALRSPGPATWHPAYLRWLAEVVWPPPAQHMVLQASGRAVPEHPARRQRLDEERQERVTAWRLTPVVAAPQALRGVQCTGAVTTGAERGDLTRLDTPSERRKCWGRIPSADSAGERRRHGAMTTAGTTHARRVLVEGPWAYRSPAKVRRHLPRRLEKPPKEIQALSGKAPGRLGQRSRTLIARGQPANQVVVASARALVGGMWAMAQAVPVPS